MLQKNLNQEISKKVDCNCIFYNRLLEKHIKNVIAEIDFSIIDQCCSYKNAQDHLKDTFKDISIAYISCESATISLMESLNYSLVGTSVLFEKDYNDSIDNFISDSDYIIVKGADYVFDIENIRSQELIIEVALMSQYGKNKNISFDAVYSFYKESIYDLWNFRSTDIFVAVDFAGALSGFISLKEQKDIITIDFLAVHKSIRRKGIAQELIKKACLYAKSLQKTIYVLTQSENTASVRLYEKAGFVQKKFQLVYSKNKE